MAVAGFLSYYLSDPLTYVRRHITVNKIVTIIIIIISITTTIIIIIITITIIIIIIITITIIIIIIIIITITIIIIIIIIIITITIIIIIIITITIIITIIIIITITIIIIIIITITIIITIIIIPVILMGSASAVTYRSEQAKLTMKTDSMFCRLFSLITPSRMSTLPNVPTTVPSPRATSRGIAISGFVLTNSWRPNW